MDRLIIIGEGVHFPDSRLLIVPNGDKLVVPPAGSLQPSSSPYIKAVADCFR